MGQWDEYCSETGWILCCRKRGQSESEVSGGQCSSAPVNLTYLWHLHNWFPVHLLKMQDQIKSHTHTHIYIQWYTWHVSWRSTSLFADRIAYLVWLTALCRRYQHWTHDPRWSLASVFPLSIWLFQQCKGSKPHWNVAAALVLCVSKF